ncbi:MAG: aminoacyl-tRNA hydrolase [Spirochaetales bacterium]|nr:aminoacyl-tRNA hydrolase [Spirochaetales bacterium]
MEKGKGVRISENILLPDDEICFSAIRAQGPGGQHVNKVSTAVQLRFNIPQSSLPEDCKSRLLTMPDNRISSEGEIVIKAGGYRSLARNRRDALDRLRQIIQKALAPPRKRKRTRAPQKAHRKRLADKKKRSDIKASRAALQ